MNSTWQDIRRRGGVATTAELLRDGHTSHQLTVAVRAGRIIRARQGHYAVPELDAQELAAVRVGGRLTGLSGLRRHGIWTPVRIGLWVEVSAHARALRSPSDARLRLAPTDRPGVVVVWVAHPSSGTRSLVGGGGCLSVVVRTQSARVAFACAESALRAGAVTRAEWGRVLAEAAASTRQRIRGAGRLSESGGESLAAFGMREAQIPFRQQVDVDGVGRVDFVVGERLVIEIDGAEFHTSRTAFETDRARDAALSIRGYRVLRFSYAQVADRWPEVHAAIVAALLRGDHLP